MASSLEHVPAGFDTVGIAVPCDDFDRVGCSVSIDGYSTDHETYRYNRKLEGGGFIGTGIGNAAWLEASLPKRVSDEDDNSVALGISDALEALYGLYDEAQQFFDPAPGHLFEESRIVRLDLVRDFHGIDRQTDLLDGLAAIDQPGRAKVRRFADPSANRAETLRVGPRAWGCTLYDKHTESRGKAPDGQIRFEARLHRPQLTSVFARLHGGQIKTVGDLVRIGSSEGIGDGGASLAFTQRAWFERVGFDRTISSRSGLADALRRAHLSHTEAAGVWAYLTLPGWGSGISKNSRSKYRRIAANLGYAPAYDGAVLPVDATQGQMIRLDYDTGGLVAA